MDASARNTNRTKDRNESAFLSLVDKLTFLENFGLYYQYCNNSKCREVTLFVMPSPNALSRKQIKAFRKMLEKANVPGVVLEYPEGDRVKVTCLGLGVEKILENQTWKQVLRLMFNQQLKHERASTKKCDQYNHDYMDKGDWSNDNADTRFSNEIRAIPGVRHIDTDGLLCCPECLTTLFVIEASSDGCPGTPMAHKFKATTMTRNIARLFDATPLLLQHFYDDGDHANPVYLTSWKTGQSKRYKKTWTALSTDFKNAYDRHKAGDCSATK